MVNSTFNNQPNLNKPTNYIYIFFLLHFRIFWFVLSEQMYINVRVFMYIRPYV